MNGELILSILGIILVPATIVYLGWKVQQQADEIRHLDWMNNRLAADLAQREVEIGCLDIELEQAREKLGAAAAYTPRPGEYDDGAA